MTFRVHHERFQLNGEADTREGASLLALAVATPAKGGLRPRPPARAEPASLRGCRGAQAASRVEAGATVVATVAGPASRRRHNMYATGTPASPATTCLSVWPLTCR